MPSTQLNCPHCGSSLNFGAAIAAGTAVECLICMRTFAANPSAVPAASPSPTPVKAASSVSAGKPPAASANPVKSEPKGRPALARPAAAASEPYAAGASSSNGPMIAILAALLFLVAGGLGVAVWKIIDSNKGDPKTDPDQPVAVNPIKKDDTGNKTDDKTKNAGDGSKTDDAKDKDASKDKNPVKDKSETKDKEISKDDGDLIIKTPKNDKDKGKDKGVLVRKDTKVPVDPNKDAPVGKDGKDKDGKGPPPIQITKTPPKAIPGAGQDRIDAAIDKGVDYLRQKQFPDGSWGFGGGHEVGFAALCGLTLLECKAPAKDPAVQKAAAFVRAKAASLEKNYDVNAVILFLDRLGEANDRQLIQYLSLRVLASQLTDGGWNYTCNALSQPEAQQLLAYLQSQKTVKPMPAVALAPNLRGLMIVKNQGVPKGKHVLGGFPQGDNSNTQFSLLALWAARRHGVPSDQAIIIVHDRFAYTQNADGGWAYETNRESSHTMTAVGLIGLAMGHGISPNIDMKQTTDPKKPVFQDVKQDERFKKGVKALGKFIGKIGDPNSAKFSGNENLYFLWCLERVGVLYKMDEIEGKDWYGWGAQLLVAQQVIDGTFPSTAYINHEPTANTCFALLFLNRSNLVRDLTVTLQLHSAIQDP